MTELINKLSTIIASFITQKGYQVSSDFIELILLLLFCSGIFPLVLKVISKFNSILKQERAEYDLHPFVDREEIKNALANFVQTRGQNISHSDQTDEPINNAAITVTKKLIPFYMDIMKSDNSEQYFLILADSGMGKSTFLINLYNEYNRILFKRKYNIKLFPLAVESIDNEIEKIPDKEKTILLLDGFDEDPEAVKNYQNRIQEIARKTWRFRKIIITARTQFFPTEQEEPNNTKIFKFSINNDNYRYFKKIYISPFSDKDVSRYIRMKFPVWKFWNIGKRFKAHKIVSLCPYLMVRPMLLSYIDSLVDSNGQKKLKELELKRVRLNMYDIYELLIDRWIERESNRIPTERRKDFVQNMQKFSEDLAIHLYEKYSKSRQVIRNGEVPVMIISKGLNNALKIKHDEILPFAIKNKINLSELELKGKSLLNRDADGNYKFAHKSILEFFLAKKAILDSRFAEGVYYFSDLKEFDQAKKFYDDRETLNFK